MVDFPAAEGLIYVVAGGNEEGGEEEKEEEKVGGVVQEWREWVVVCVAAGRRHFWSRRMPEGRGIYHGG